MKLIEKTIFKPSSPSVLSVQGNCSAHTVFPKLYCRPNAISTFLRLHTHYLGGNKTKEEMAPASRKSLPSHIKLSNNGDGYYCVPCEKVLNSKNRIYYHYDCSNKNKHKCDQCKKSFSTRSYLNHHMEMHDTTTYKCQECDKYFTNSVVLQKHMKLHQRAKFFDCKYCKNQFRSNETLIAHELKHKNTFNYKCSDCDKKYTTKSALEQHKLKHSAKKFKCTHCEKHFQRNSTLKLHLKRHNSNEFFLCSICFKKFSDASALQRHSKMHNNDNHIKYKCKECDTITTRKDNMQRHLRIMHSSKSFDSCVDTVHPEENRIAVTNQDECSVSLEILECDNNINQPKTVANSSVIKFIGNVEPITVPNLMSAANLEETIESKDPTYIELKTVNEIDIGYASKKKKYDPIEMYRKILNSDEQTESLNGPSTDAAPISIKLAENQQRNTSFTNSNFSETHWRKNFKYTYTQHQS